MAGPDPRRSPGRHRHRRTNEEIAERTFKMGTTAAISSSVGRNKDGVKTPVNLYVWLGGKLSQNQRFNAALEFRIGVWTARLLLKLKPKLFDLDGSILILPWTDELAELREELLRRAAHNNPYLLPTVGRTAPWTSVRREVPDGQEIVLVSRRYSEEPVQRAIDSGVMRVPLRAVNYLGDVLFTINKPILDIARQLRPELPLPPSHRIKSDADREARKEYWEYGGS
jgi:hypothetical protein